MCEYFVPFLIRSLIQKDELLVIVAKNLSRLFEKGNLF